MLETTASAMINFVSTGTTETTSSRAAAHRRAAFGAVSGWSAAAAARRALASASRLHSEAFMHHTSATLPRRKAGRKGYCMRSLSFFGLLRELPQKISKADKLSKMFTPAG